MAYWFRVYQEKHDVTPWVDIITDPSISRELSIDFDITPYFITENIDSEITIRACSKWQKEVNDFFAKYPSYYALIPAAISLFRLFPEMDFSLPEIKEEK